ncbi:FAD:protein FMN transferase [Caldichromatium japonicum]|uniref:FAD:protein FMN transferase n=1 Tax=Caldichromatium japonicum TaxID=2699430 RepID=A0A6G7VC54_9GAMM|nr:FAD:protein FMN transferase [Caldichromatium japonicum]QIK37532.1 FAD:protein FMN transferase [Caldichromatium japonicum]
MEVHRLCFRAMGSPCEILLAGVGQRQAKAAAAWARAEIERLEQCYSRYRSESLLSAINQVAQTGGTIAVDAETAALLDYAAVCYRESEGLFDITSGILRQAWRFDADTLPAPEKLAALCARIGWDKVRWERPRLGFGQTGMELDLGGIVKEYAADRAALLCLESGIRHGLINLGGDLRAIGPLPDGQPWRVGIRDPEHLRCLLGWVPLGEGALATSGDYLRCRVIKGRRYSHLFNPRTGWPVFGLTSVSAMAASCLVAGSLSTIAMLKGKAGAQWLAELSVPHLWLDDQGRRGGAGVFARLLAQQGTQR